MNQPTRTLFLAVLLTLTIGAAILPATALSQKVAAFSYLSPVASPVGHISSAMPKGFGFPSFNRVLPPGKGDAATGRKIFAQKCANCHKPAGAISAGVIGDMMSRCWRYPKPLFLFVKKTMPMSKAGSLTNSEVYAALAFILWDAGIIGPKEIMNAQSLARVELPGRLGFIPSTCQGVSHFR